MGSRGARAKALFQAALELDGEERLPFLEASCKDDTALRREVESLLGYDQSPDIRVDEAAPVALALSAPPTPLSSGQTLGPYRLKRCLAVGGMGAIYEAVHEESGRTVAVKVLRADVASDQLRHRFRVEFGFLARLQHPGIAHVYEANVVTLDSRPVPYMAMELVEGARSITDHAREEGLSIEARIELFLRVCEAVHHGHQRGVIHRDLKPANILVDRGGSPKLIDFGVAMAVDPEGATRRTQVGVLLGTVQYMSPEQCSDPRDVDVRSDVYSLGVVLYELLCGRLPYDLDDAPLPVATRIVQEHPPRRPSTVAGKLGADLEAILLKTLEKPRDRRYRSVADLADDLQRYLRKEPIEARPPGALYRLGLFARRHRVLAAALVTVTAIAIVSALAITRFAFREKRSRIRQEYSAYQANVSAAEASLRVFDAAGARRRLARVPPEQRGWEWDHLATRLDCALNTFSGPYKRCSGLAYMEGVVAAFWESAAGDCEVVVQDVESGAVIARHGPLTGSANGVALTPEGKVVWNSNVSRERGDFRLNLWDPKQGSVNTQPAAHSDAISALCFSPAGYLVTASLDGTVRTWDAGTLEPRGVIAVGETPLRSLCVSADGLRVAAGGVDGSIRILRIDMAEPVVLRGGPRAILALAFDPDRRLLAAGSEGGTIRVWDVETGRPIDRLVGHSSEVRALAFPGDRLVSASNDGTLRVWNPESGTTENVLYGHANWVTSLAALPGAGRVVSGAYDGTLKVWDLGATPGTRAFRVHSAIVRDLAFSPSNRLLATASRDGRVKLLDPGTGRELLDLDGAGGRVWAVAFHPGGELLAAGADDGVVRIWEVASGELRRELAGHEQGVSGVAFSHDGRLLATASWDGRVILRDVGGWSPVATFQHDHPLNGVAFHPTEPLLAVVDQSKRVHAWDVRTGRSLWMRAAATLQHDVEFSPDGRVVATATGDIDGARFGVQLWDSRTGEPLRTISGHKDVVYGVAFSPDGKRIASASADGTVRLWDPRTAEEMLVLRGHESWAWCVAFSPDGRALASGGGNYEGVGVGIRIWARR